MYFSLTEQNKTPTFTKNSFDFGSDPENYTIGDVRNSPRCKKEIFKNSFNKWSILCVNLVYMVLYLKVAID
tara:strand:- start:43569 stop:43781 length:213 start_codon:yes stop_codon:yes gene_type:complete